MKYFLPLILAFSLVVHGQQNDTIFKNNHSFEIVSVRGIENPNAKFYIDEYIKIIVKQKIDTTTISVLKKNIFQFSDSLIRNCKIVNTKKYIDSVWNKYHEKIFNINNAVQNPDKSLENFFSEAKTKDLILWIDGVCFSNLKVWNANLKTNELIFILQYDSAKNSAWNTLYGYSYRNPFRNGNKCVKLQIGIKDRTLTDPYQHPVEIEIRVAWMVFVGYGAILLLLFIFVWYFIRKQHMLRDFNMFDSTVKLVNKVSTPPGPNEVLWSDIPRSLSRTQLAFWTILVGISFIFIWLNLDELSGINATVVALLGISGGTSVVAKLIDTNHADVAKGTPITAQQFNTGDYKTQGFWKDILSDEKGISVHRFQLIMFNMGLGFYFLWHVVYYLTMPEFSNTLLLLLGVSNATYAGIKFNEKSS